MGILEILAIVAQVLPAIVALASAIAAVTPTPRDDKWAGIAYKYLVDLPALNVGKAKDK